MTKVDKEKMVIELFQNGMNIRNIAKRVHMSFADIGLITRKFSGDDDPRRSKKYSKHSQALQLFESGYSTLQVAIELGLSDSETTAEFKQFMTLKGLDGFCELYDQTRGDIGSFILLDQELKLARIGIRDVIEGIILGRQLDDMKTEYNDLWTELKMIKGEIYQESNNLKELKRQTNSVRGILEAGKAAVWNEIPKK